MRLPEKIQKGAKTPEGILSLLTPIKQELKQAKQLALQIRQENMRKLLQKEHQENLCDLLKINKTFVHRV